MESSQNLRPDEVEINVSYEEYEEGPQEEETINESDFQNTTQNPEQSSPQPQLQTSFCPTYYYIAPPSMDYNTQFAYFNSLMALYKQVQQQSPLNNYTLFYSPQTQTVSAPSNDLLNLYQNLSNYYYQSQKQECQPVAVVVPPPQQQHQQQEEAEQAAYFDRTSTPQSPIETHHQPSEYIPEAPENQEDSYNNDEENEGDFETEEVQFISTLNPYAEEFVPRFSWVDQENENSHMSLEPLCASSSSSSASSTKSNFFPTAFSITELARKIGKTLKKEIFSNANKKKRQTKNDEIETVLIVDLDKYPEFFDELTEKIPKSVYVLVFTSNPGEIKIKFSSLKYLRDSIMNGSFHQVECASSTEKILKQTVESLCFYLPTYVGILIASEDYSLNKGSQRLMGVTKPNSDFALSSLLTKFCYASMETSKCPQLQAIEKSRCKKRRLFIRKLKTQRKFL